MKLKTAILLSIAILVLVPLCIVSYFMLANRPLTNSQAEEIGQALVPMVLAVWLFYLAGRLKANRKAK